MNGKKKVKNDITQGPLVNSNVALIPPFISKLGRARRPLVVATPHPVTSIGTGNHLKCVHGAYFYCMQLWQLKNNKKVD